MQMAGQNVVKQAGCKQYEGSAYAQPTFICKHNTNYCRFCDYLRICAGAHSKITMTDEGSVIRFAETKHPKDYLTHTAVPNTHRIEGEDLIFEFMLNAMRLSKGFTPKLFNERTGLAIENIAPQLHDAQ